METPSTPDPCCVVVGCTSDAVTDTLDPIQRRLCLACRTRARALLRAQPGIGRRELLEALVVEPQGAA